MPDDFDPYHKWLGIPAEDQPPHHYRLLGITLFEADLDVIASAADRQMAYLRTFQGGKNAAFSQRLLNEAATARLCLLDGKKKAAYDAELRQIADANEITSDLPANGAAMPEPAPAQLPVVAPAAAQPAARRGPRRGAGPVATAAKVAVGGLAGVVIAALIVRFVFQIDLTGTMPPDGPQVVASSSRPAGERAGHPAAPVAENSAAVEPPVSQPSSAMPPAPLPPAKAKSKRAPPPMAKTAPTAPPASSPSAKPKVAPLSGPIENELKAAKESYLAALAAAGERLLAAFDEEKKRLTSNLQAEALQQERLAFLTGRKLPASPAMKVAASDYRTQLAMAQARCQRAFESAANAWMKQNEVQRAKAALAEMPGFFSDSGAGGGKWVSLFNADNLAGWKITGNPKHHWRVVDGILVGSGPPNASFLVTERRDFASFHLRLEMLPPERQNSSVVFRQSTLDNAEASYRAFIPIAGPQPKAESSAGEIFFAPRPLIGPNPQSVLQKAAPRIPLAAGQWFTIEVLAMGNRIAVLVNGQQVVDFQDSNPRIAAGAVGIQCRGDSTVRIRKAEIKELPSVAAIVKSS